MNYLRLKFSALSNMFNLSIYFIIVNSAEPRTKYLKKKITNKDTCLNEGNTISNFKSFIFPKKCPLRISRGQPLQQHITIQREIQFESRNYFLPLKALH